MKSKCSFPDHSTCELFNKCRFSGHVFLQQPYHPTFHALERLDACTAKLYSSCQCPTLPSQLPVNTVCVAAYEGGWYRCQVVSVDEAGQQCGIKYLDYGGYHTLPIDDLRQIRTDFLTLPFQVTSPNSLYNF